MPSTKTMTLTTTQKHDPLNSADVSTEQKAISFTMPYFKAVNIQSKWRGTWFLDFMLISHSVDLILKLVGIIWNRTSVEVVDKFSSTTVDLIRSERELENMHLYGV